MKTNTEIKKSHKPGYKLTKLGWIPEKWEVLQIKEFGTVITGSTPPTNDFENYNGNYLFVTPGDIGKSKYLTNSNINISKKGFEFGRKIVKGSVMFVCIGSTIGKAAIAEIDLITNQQINSIVVNNNNNEEYLYYQLCYHNQRIKRIAGHQAVPIINKSTFEKVLIPSPPFSEQQNIAQILSTWDKAIEKTGQLIHTKTQLKKGLMQQLLTGRKRFMEYNDLWKEYHLNKLVTKAKGSIVATNKERKGVPLIDTSAFNGEAEYYTKDINAKQCKISDILILWDGSKAGCVMTNKEGVVGSTFCRLTPNNKIHNEFLANRMIYDEERIMAVREGSGIPHVPKDFLSWYKVKVSCYSEQERIAKTFNIIDEEINELDQILKLNKKQKKGLMQKLLTGEVRVKI